MDSKIFVEEENKLKDVVCKITKEEENLENELKSASLQYDMENIAKGQVLQMKVKRLDDINKIKDVPYFARMDFKEDKGKLEKFYLGKLSILDSKSLEPIVVDWRAPISNLYYEGKLGKASYECLGEQISGEIYLKRQYIIESKKLKKYVDINVTGNDELLQNALEEKADDRLKNIVATIQDEQNKIIRSDINLPLIVQGVAGSGKTTIALHRIAYLIYNYKKQFKPEEFMILAPTKFFLDYISNILPDLGVDNVKQCTFEDFAYDVIGKKIKISDNNEKLVIIVNKDFDEVNKGKVDIMIKEAKFKSSIKFKYLVDEFLEIVEENYIPKKDFTFNKYTIMTYDKINSLFKDTYKMYNFNTRINEIEKNLTSEFKKKIPEIINEIKSQRSKSIENLNQQERIKVFDEYDKIIKLVEKDYKKIVKKYLNEIPKKDCLNYYKEFIQDFLNEDNEMLKYLKENTIYNINNNEVCFEDLAPIMYISLKVFGIKERCQIKHVVIDEAQDYGEFGFDVLKTIINSNSMTILGDIAQGVHFYRGIENWNTFINVEFKNTKTVYKVLDKTYRTTKEIMEVANSVINKLPEYEKESIVFGKPVIDRKNSINIDKVKDDTELINKINMRIEKYLQSDYKSIAIIGKDMNECEKIQRKIAKVRNDVKLIKGKDSSYNSGISIVPSYLAKGLEFDCVIIADASNEKYIDNSLDIKLLYVTITRAMSKLDIFYIGEISKLLK